MHAAQVRPAGRQAGRPAGRQAGSPAHLTSVAPKGLAQTSHGLSLPDLLTANWAADTKESELTRRGIAAVGLLMADS